MATGEEQYKKMTETKISKLVISLGIPTTISMLVTNIYNLADTYFVGELGTSASGAVGIVFGFMALLQAFGFMFGQGAGSIISRRLGARKNEEAGIYGSTSLVTVMLLGVIISAISLMNMNGILKLLGATETIRPLAEDYIIYITLAAPFIMGSFVLNNILRYEGKASLAMIGLVSGSVLNIIGDPLFITGFKMEIAGAGLSTAVSQCVSFVILLTIFLSGRTETKMSFKNVRMNISIIGEVVTTGMPSALRQGMASISTMILNRISGNYSDAAIAAMSIVNRLNFFMFSIGLGLGQGFQPVCAYNYGAKKYGRVKEAILFTLCATEVVLGTMAVVGLIFSDGLIGVFRDDVDVIEFGTLALRISCIALFFQPLAVIANMTFQSTGKKALASFTSILRSGLYFIPILLIFEALFKETGIQIAQPVADILSFFTVLPFILNFVRNLGRQSEETLVK